jgi:DNA modification methylase
MKIDFKQGDCLELIKTLPDDSVDLIVTDPPYGVEFSKGFNDSIENVYENIDKWICEMYRVLKDGCHCYIFVPTKELDIWLCSVKKYFNFKNLLATRCYTQSVYLKDNFSFNNQPIIFCSKGKAKRLKAVDWIPTSESWFKDKRNTNPKPFTYQYPAFLPYFSNEKTTSKNNKRSGRHPCAKSVGFIENLIKLSSDEESTVFDPFVGGGSTALACINTNRNFIGYELNEDYFNIAKDRIDTALQNIVV